MKLQAIEKRKQQGDKVPPLYYAHGRKDPLVLFQWGKATCEDLAISGVPVSYTLHPNMYHELKKAELLDLEKFILTKSKKKR